MARANGKTIWTSLKSAALVSTSVAALSLSACAPAENAEADAPDAAAEAAAAMAASSIALASDPSALGFNATGFDAARADIQSGMDDGVIPGGVLLVARGGEVVELLTIGQQGPNDTTPMSTETIFRIYSMTKPIVSVAAMQMVEEGKISLDDPVSKFFPEYAEMTVITETGETVPATNAMTVRHLMAHTSGLIYGIFDPESNLGKQYLEAGGTRFDITGQELAKTLGTLPLRSDPGTAWNYSRSTDVLGAVLEVADERPLDELLEARILGPLGMDDTSFYVPEEKADRLAEAPEGIVLSTPLVVDKMLSGGGGLNSTTEDYFRFVEMLRNEGEYRGVRIIKPETLAEMTTNLVTEDVDRSNWFYGPLGGFGLGFGLLPVDMMKPNDGEYFSWGGFAGTNMWVDADNDITMVFMMQNNEASDRFRALQRSWVYGGFAPETETTTEEAAH